jgi:hypothetical protein
VQACSEYHYLLLYADKLVAINQVSGKVAAEVNWGPGSHTPSISGENTHFTLSSVLDIMDPARNWWCVWHAAWKAGCLLESALSAAQTPAQPVASMSGFADNRAVHVTLSALLLPACHAVPCCAMCDVLQAPRWV